MIEYTGDSSQNSNNSENTPVPKSVKLVETLDNIEILSADSVDNCHDCPFSELAAYKNAQNLTNNFNYNFSDNKRLEIGDRIYQIGLENSILVPYTSFIYMETDEQKELAEIEMKSKDKYNNPDFSLEMANTGSPLTFSLVLFLLALILNTRVKLDFRQESTKAK